MAASLRQRTATHEAGHVCAAIVYGIPVLSVTIDYAPNMHRGHLQSSARLWVRVLDRVVASRELRPRKCSADRSPTAAINPTCAWLENAWHVPFPTRCKPPSNSLVVVSPPNASCAANSPDSASPICPRLWLRLGTLRGEQIFAFLLIGMPAMKKPRPGPRLCFKVTDQLPFWGRQPSRHCIAQALSERLALPAAWSMERLSEDGTRT
jgi:hypothetical protein